MGFVVFSVLCACISPAQVVVWAQIHVKTLFLRE